MVGGTTPPQSDSGEISRVLVLNLLWQSKRCSRTAQDISVLTTPSLLSRAPSCLGMWEKWRHPPPWFLGIWRSGRPAEPTLRLRMPALLTALPEPVPSWLGQWQSG